MNEFEIVLDFSGDTMGESEKARLLKAIDEGKKFKTKMTYFGDGDYNAFSTNELSMVFDTNTLVSMATEMGFKVDNEDLTEEEKQEIIDDMNKNGYDDGYKTYLEESKEDFLD